VLQKLLHVVATGAARLGRFHRFRFGLNCCQSFLPVRPSRCVASGGNAWLSKHDSPSPAQCVPLLFPGSGIARVDGAVSTGRAVCRAVAGLATRPGWTLQKCLVQPCCRGQSLKSYLPPLGPSRLQRVSFSDGLILPVRGALS
jgi:hypothetical protein